MDDAVELDKIFAALSDSMRRSVLVQLLEREAGEHPCASFEFSVSKSTRTHHWRVLQESGLIDKRDAGNGSFVRLRRSEIDTLHPGLWQMLLGERPQRPTS